MKAKKPRNKAYRPKANLTGGGLQALVRIEDRARIRTINNSTYRPEDLTDLRTAYWVAFANLKQGHPTEEAWGHVCFSLNLALVLCELGFGSEWTDTVVAALDGIFKAKQRGDRTGRYGLDGDAIKAVTDALEVHDQQMEVATRAETAQAYAIVQQRIAAGNVYTAEQVH
jgi:hypothetical protein